MDLLDWRLANSLLDEMAGEGRAILESSGLAADEISYRRSADLRYMGQGHEVTVALPDGVLTAGDLVRIGAAFESAYEALYGRKGPDVALEVINWRLVASGPQPDTKPSLPRHAAAGAEARKGSRKAYFPECGGYVEATVYDRYLLQPGMSFAGPAIVEERESTLVIGARAQAQVDAQLNVVVELLHDE
jgi:N-methylhydantoinase A